MKRYDDKDYITDYNDVHDKKKCIPGEKSGNLSNLGKRKFMQIVEDLNKITNNIYRKAFLRLK